MMEQLEREQFNNERIFKKYEKLNNQLSFLQAEKSAYKIKEENIKLELEKCNKELNVKEKKLNELEKVNDEYSLFIRIKNELNNVNNDNYYYDNKINEYKHKNEEYLDKIKQNKDNENLMFFMMFFQLVLIIGILIAFCFLYDKNNSDIKENIEFVKYNRFTSFT